MIIPYGADNASYHVNLIFENVLKDVFSAVGNYKVMCGLACDIIVSIE